MFEVLGGGEAIRGGLFNLAKIQTVMTLAINLDHCTERLRGVARAGDRGQIDFIRILTLHNCTAAYCSGEVCSSDGGFPCAAWPGWTPTLHNYTAAQGSGEVCSSG